MMYLSNFESMRLKPVRTCQDRRLRHLENQVKQLKEYRKRARSNKIPVINGLIFTYESLIESIYSKLDK